MFQTPFSVSITSFHYKYCLFRSKLNRDFVSGYFYRITGKLFVLFL